MESIVVYFVFDLKTRLVRFGTAAATTNQIFLIEQFECWPKYEANQKFKPPSYLNDCCNAHNFHLKVKGPDNCVKKTLHKLAALFRQRQVSKITCLIKQNYKFCCCCFTPTPGYNFLQIAYLNLNFVAKDRGRKTIFIAICSI